MLPLDFNAVLSTDQLAEALYEGSRGHIHNLAEKLARQHGQASALTFYAFQGDDVRNFWRAIATILISHSAEWQPNQGSACVLSERERARLGQIARVPDWKPAERPKEEGTDAQH